MSIRDKVLPPKRRPSINSKDKGNANERAVAKWLSAWTGKNFVRTPSSGGLRWQNSLGLNICGDVVCTNQGHVFPFTVETKHLKDISFKVTDASGNMRRNAQVLSIFIQSNRDAIRDGKHPLMLLRCNGMPKDTWWIFIPTRLYSVLPIIPNTYKRLRVDNLMGIHSEDLKKVNYDELCKALH